MRVGVVMEQSLAPVPGGTGRYGWEMAGALARRPGLDVTGWTAWHRDTTAAAAPGVHGPRRLPLPRRPLVLAWETGTGPTPGGRPDAVYAPTLLAPPRRGRPLVVTVHDAVPWTHPETLTARGVRWHRRMAERVAVVADVVTVPTAAVEAELRRHLRLGLVSVVGGGVSAALLQPTATAGPGAPTGEYLLSLATLEPRKGLDVLIAALARPEAPDLPLVVVGQPGWGGVHPVELARAHGLAEDRVRVLGRLPDDQLGAVLRGALALVVPSRAEGFGLPVAEAMAAGVPVVVSADPALLEVGGDAVAVAPVGDAVGLAAVLAAVAGDGAERRRMIDQGLVEARRHTWDGAAARLARVLADLGG